MKVISEYAYKSIQYDDINEMRKHVELMEKHHWKVVIASYVTLRARYRTEVKR